MKAISYTDNIYYFNHKTKKKESKFDKVSRDFRYIPRADNPGKSLSRVARTLASNYDDMIRKDSNKIIFVSHKFISGITEVGNRQNNNIHKQLSDIFKIKYHQSVIINGKKYRDGFTVQYTENTEIILKNPKLFYTKKSKENCQLDGKKFPVRWKKISTYKYKETPRNEREREHLKYVENPIEEKEEEALAYSSSFSVSSIINDKSEDTEKELSQQKNIDVPTLAVSPFNGLAKVYQTKGETHKLSFTLERQPKVNNNLETVFSLNQSAQEEKEHYKAHRNRESNGQEFSLLKDLPIFSKLCNPHISQGKEGAIVQIVEKIEGYCEMSYNSSEPDNPKPNCDMQINLSPFISQTFTTERSVELIKNCEVNQIESDKVGIKLGEGLVLSSVEKEKLRSCIKLACGENTKIISLNKPEEKPRENKATDVQSEVENFERFDPDNYKGPYPMPTPSESVRQRHKSYYTTMGKSSLFN